MRSWCPRTSSTRSTGRSATAACSTGPIRAVAGRARSTTSTAAAGSTSRTRPATTWRSSPARTGREAEPRLEYGDALAAEAWQHLGPIAEYRDEFGGATLDHRTSITVAPTGVGRPQPQAPRVPEGGHERIRYGHLSIQHCGQGVRRDVRVHAESEEHVELMRDVVTEEKSRGEIAPNPPWFPHQPLELIEKLDAWTR